MTFQNDKKTFLAKMDKSKKGNIDEKVVSLLEVINANEEFYTTSSCSGRVYLWKGTGRKNETQWLKLSHDLVDEDFFGLQEGMVWLRVEPFILHVACRDLESANTFLEKARRVCKKSCLLSASKKIIVEVRGSEFIEMPLCKDGVMLFCGDIIWLKELVNSTLERIWERLREFERELSR